MSAESGLASFLKSRWFIVPAAFIAVTLGWLAYVERPRRTASSRASSSTPAGARSPGATVVMFERGFVTHEQRGRATTDADGTFRFTDNRSHSIQLEAEAPGLGRTDRRVLRLWFAAQDARLHEPLRFPAPK